MPNELKEKSVAGNIRIDSERCRGCGRCMEQAGADVIQLEDYKARLTGSGRVPAPEAVAEVCPEGAISVVAPAGQVIREITETAPAALVSYFAKMKGVTTSPARVNGIEIFWSWVGAFLGIAAVSYMNFNMLADTDMVMIIGSFGASAVLIYGAIKSPLAQPRNLVGGHFISAFIGVACWQIFGSMPWLAASLAVATAIAAMHATKTLHPPGGATALIAVIGSSKVHALGYLYAFIPVGAGALIMLLIALLVNNIPETRRYPEFWG